jgi:hypothetical protein
MYLQEQCDLRGLALPPVVQKKRALLSIPKGALVPKEIRLRALAIGKDHE